jgi:hypothetical protein
MPRCCAAPTAWISTGSFSTAAGRARRTPGPGGFWQGLVAVNKLWREGPGHDKWLVLGETDIDLLTVNLDGSEPVLRDKVSGDVNEAFPSVEAAIQRLLATRS